MLACDFQILAHGVFEFDAPGVGGVWYNHFLCSSVGAELHHCLNLKEKHHGRRPIHLNLTYYSSILGFQWTALTATGQQHKTMCNHQKRRFPCTAANASILAVW